MVYGFYYMITDNFNVIIGFIGYRSAYKYILFLLYQLFCFWLNTTFI